MAEWVLIKEGRLIAADVIRWKEGIYAARRSRKRKATRRSGTWEKRDVLGEFWHVLASEGGPKTTTYVLQLRLLIRRSQVRALVGELAGARTTGPKFCNWLRGSRGSAPDPAFDQHFGRLRRAIKA